MTPDRSASGNRTTPAVPDWLAEVPFAHRGLHAAGRDPNSVEAVAAAAIAGYGVEIDVRLSRDQVPVVVHDPRVGHVADTDEAGARKVSDMGAADLQRQGVAPLADVLAAAAGAPLMIEIKSSRPAARMLEPLVAAAMRAYDGPWCVASFNPLSLRWFRRNAPSVPRVLTAQLARSDGVAGAVGRRLEQLRDLHRVEPAAVSYELDGLPSTATDRWRYRGGLLIAWTAVGPAGVERARQLADNLIFEQAHP
ncbi:MAG: glycerophosphodiester phosphodiesterase family protein [Nitriliruptoraceae bacterium]